MGRTVVLHYHLFKNAGTSVDRILKQNFGDRWVTCEFDAPQDQQSDRTAAWIAANPDAVAFSSHTASGPIPQIDAIDIVSVVFLRDPVQRIRSAYEFERRQGTDSWGAQLAAANSFADYVHHRLAHNGDRQCRDFQTHRLAGMMPGPEPELDRAIRALDQFTIVGLVEHFEDAISRLATRLEPRFPDFHWTPVHANQTAHAPAQPQDDDLATLLGEANAADHELLRRARQKFAPAAAKSKTPEP